MLLPLYGRRRTMGINCFENVLTTFMVTWNVCNRRQVKNIGIHILHHRLEWNVTRFVRNIFEHASDRPWVRRRPIHMCIVYVWLGLGIEVPFSSFLDQEQNTESEVQKHFQIPCLRRYTRRKLFFRVLSRSRVLPCHSGKIAVSSRLN